MSQRVRGFTLIELMIVVAVVAILAAIAYPSFNEQVRKSRRAEAAAHMGSIKLSIERWRADNPSYATFPADRITNTAHYSFQLQAGADATNYEIRATGTGAQLNDRCGTLTARARNADGTEQKKPQWATADCN